MGNAIGYWESTVTETETLVAPGKGGDWVFDEETFPGYTLIHTRRDPGGGLMVKQEAGLFRDPEGIVDGNLEPLHH